LLDDDFGFFWIIPEIGIKRVLFFFSYFFKFAGYVKDTPLTLPGVRQNH
jgi:hypothetical protein